MRVKPQVPLETFSKVVEAIYDCALDPKHWKTSIGLIADLMDSQRCVLGVHDYVSGCNDLAYQMGYEDEHWWRLHEEKYSSLSPLLPLRGLGKRCDQAGPLLEDRHVQTN